MSRVNFMFLLLALAITRFAQAETVEGLIAAGELEARVVVETADPLFQKSPVVIAVEVGTPRWFSRGTRVRDFTVPGTLVRPVSKFALNDTRRRDGDSWAFQSWRFRLYAERAGTLVVPPLTSFISVDTETHGVVEGEIRLEVPPLEIVAPPGTEGLVSWVAGTGLKVDESWEGILETYQIGDAVTRVRRFSIRGAPAMAIPASPDVEPEGVQMYAAPPLVDDNTVRGSLEGIREERVVFTVKTVGTHTIPGHSIHWFNLDTQAVEQIDFPDRTLEVTGGVPTDAAVDPEPQGGAVNLWYWGLALVGAALGYLLLRWLLRTTLFQRVRGRVGVWRENRRAKAAFMNAAAQQDSRRCLELLYQRMSGHAGWQLSTARPDDPQLSAVAAALMAHAYGDGRAPEASQVQRLWQLCTAPGKPPERKSALQLNPGPSR